MSENAALCRYCSADQVAVAEPNPAGIQACSEGHVWYSQMPDPQGTAAANTEQAPLFQFIRGTVTTPDNGASMDVLLILDGTHVRPASRAEEAMYDLLSRLREWDVLNLAPGSGDDGPFWQGEIARVIGAR